MSDSKRYSAWVFPDAEVSCKCAHPSATQGLFTTLGGASVSTLVGLWFGAVLLTLRSHRGRLQAWATRLGAAVGAGLRTAPHRSRPHQQEPVREAQPLLPGTSLLACCWLAPLQCTDTQV